ncbi:MAG: PDZ domain-containing protein [Deltaproteobacteria bacterium]|nr:PDZ domain-containing protein [Deltaproteobacteria bacterium]MBZ0219134.1 PDZ domain-containing protein [Deltaproteobacteria bacterium]
MSRIRIINIVLALAAFPLLGLLARDYILLGYQPKPRPQAAATLPEEPRAEAAFEEYAAVVENGIYPGKAGKLTKIELRGPAGAGPEAPLPELKLIGTYTGAKGFAVFSKEGTEGESVFKVGDSVFGSGVLMSVSPGRAVVSTGSGEAAYRVFIEEIPESLSAMGKKSAAEAPPDKDLAYSRQITEKDWVIERGAVENALGDMGRIMTDARLTPRVSNGAVQGFLVSEIKPRGVFDAIGLKDGDVLTSINGYRIDSPEKAVQVLSALKGETSFDLGVIRQGQPRSFRYSIQ